MAAIHNSSDVVSTDTSEDSDDEVKITGAIRAPRTERGDGIPVFEDSDVNSIATANLSNMDNHHKKIVNAQIMDETDHATGLEPKMVTPSRALRKVKNSLRLGNMFGLMNMLSPTKHTMKDGHVVQSIRDTIQTIDNSTHNQSGNDMIKSNGVKTKTKGKPKSNTNKDGDGITPPRSGVTNTMLVGIDDMSMNIIKSNKSN